MKRLCDIVDCENTTLINSIKTDSRKVMNGDLFVAVRGFNKDHHLYINSAIENGACAIIGDEDIDCSIPYIKVNSVNEALPTILSNFYDGIEKKFSFIGITGTDGKTTTATIIAKILDCCYIGTNGVTYKNMFWGSNNTTPELCELYQYLVELNKLGCKTVVMEVSSEALLHKRVDSIKFDITAFTNITEDHLNIHKTIENYVNTKKKLFTLTNKNGFILLNRDDNNYFNVEKSCKGNVNTYGQNDTSIFRMCKINCQKNSISFDIIYDNKTYHVDSRLTCLYNAYNICLAFGVTVLYGEDPIVVLNKISSIDNISGRGEVLKFGQKYTIILDYAHTYNGIYNIISNLRDNYDEIIVVTGAAGGREKEKRTKIGKMLLENTDYVIFTMDDPRYEDVNEIIDQLLSNTDLSNYERIVDRRKAIFRALSIAKVKSLVLILGKGRDNYMAIGDKKIKYCDYDVIKEYFDSENN